MAKLRCDGRKLAITCRKLLVSGAPVANFNGSIHFAVFTRELYKFLTRLNYV